jgi:hypothetical protein
LAKRLHLDGEKAVVEHALHLRRAQQALELRGDFRGNRLNDFLRGGDEVDLFLARAVLGLRQEIGRDEIGPRSAIRDDHHFARAGQ